jgi:hypothetical protein
MAALLPHYPQRQPFLVFFYILQWLYLLVLLLYHLWLHLYWIISNLLLYLIKLCLYLSCWVIWSQLPHRETFSSALAGSLTCPSHLLRENELNIEQIKMMQFSTKNKEQIRFLCENKAVLKDDMMI